MSGSLNSDRQRISALPGYRRVIRVEPGPGAVLAMLEDDLHCMAVRLRHDGERVQAVEAMMDRVPWTVCPGALDVLALTFTTLALDQISTRPDKQRNCTHLHDLAVIGAAHARDDQAVEYEIFVSDPCINGGQRERRLHIFKNGRLLHEWLERDGRFAEPEEAAGLNALTLRDWIGGLEGEAQEAARLLQWAALVALGRGMNDEERRRALAVRPNCYTMQPGRVEQARMASGLHDFSAGGRRPLERLRERLEAAHGR